METGTKILSGISDGEKGAYLSAIASIATADTTATQEEVEYLVQLCKAADCSAEQQQLVLQAAQSTDDAALIQSLDILKNSELRFSLVTDLFAFAKSDGNYSEAEQQNVHKLATYLGVDDTQFELLGEVAEKASTTTEPPADANNFLSSLGLGDKLKQSGINGSGLLKSLVTMAAPFIISKMMGRNRSAGGTGGIGGMMGGGMMNGGIGSLIGMLSGGKGLGAAGGLLGRIFS